MTRDEIDKEFDQFFEFDTEDRSIVTSVSAKLFAERIAALTVATEREACAKVCEEFGEEWMCDSHELAKIIRARSNE